MKTFLILAGLATVTGLPAFAGFMMGFSGGTPATLTIVTTTNAGGFLNNSFQTGRYDSAGNSDNTSSNYLVNDPTVACIGGGCGSPSTLIGQHDFFSFRLGNGIITGTILSATLTVANPAGGYAGPAGGMLMSLWDVTTANTTLNATNTGRVDIYDDIGGGTLYGTRVVNSADNGTNVVFTLNSAALAAITSSSGTNGSSLFAIGGSVGANAAPEPATWGLMSAGLLGLVLRRRR